MRIEIRTESGVKTYDLDSFGKDIVSFGRGSGCDIQIPINFVSREHGVFKRVNNTWHIVDNNSTNGLIKDYVDGRDPIKIRESPLDENSFVIAREASVITIRRINEQQWDTEPARMSDRGGYSPSAEQNSGTYSDNRRQEFARPSSPTPKKFNWKKILTIAAAVLVVCIAAGYYIYTNVDTTFDDGNRTDITRIRAYKYHKSNPTDELYEVVKGTYAVKFEATPFLSQPTFYTNDIVIVYFDDNMSAGKKKKIMRKYGLGVLAQCDTLNQVQLYVGKKDLDELEDLCSDIEEEDGVLFATTDELGPMFAFDSFVTDDPWDSENDGAWWYQMMIHSQEAWQNAVKMRKVKVGVYDCGLDVNHEDLEDQITCLHKEDEDVSDKDFERSGAHATHVAGIIGATQNNGIGIAGVAPNVSMLFNDAYRDHIDIDFKLFNIDLFSLQVNYISEFGWYYHMLELLKEDCRVVNVSMGKNYDYEEDASQKDMIDKEGYYASFFISRMLDKGYDFIICQAAGNSNRDSINSGGYSSITKDNCYTKDRKYEDIISHVIIVGAITGTVDPSTGESVFQELTNFTDYGEHVSVCAPGEQIYSCIHPYADVNKYYEYYDGTSMATPIVTGVCAMTWGANSDLKAEEVKDIVCNSNDYTTTYEGVEYRIVNAGQAVEEALDRLEKEKNKDDDK